jgi:hypothetical protein
MFNGFPSSPREGIAPGGSGSDGSMVYPPLMVLLSRMIVRKLVGGTSGGVGVEDEDEADVDDEALMGGGTTSDDGVASFFE